MRPRFHAGDARRGFEVKHRAAAPTLVIAEETLTGPAAGAWKELVWNIVLLRVAVATGDGGGMDLS